MTALFGTVGPRARQRASPRMGITLAGVGCALAVAGVLAVGADGLAGTSRGGDGSRAPGVGLSLLTTAAGYIVAVVTRRGPLATAGGVAGALGTPALVFFLTFTGNRGPNLDAVLLVSTIVWGITYLAGPVKGRPFHLGLALAGLWLFIVEQFEPVLGFGFVFRVLVLPIESAFGSAPDYTVAGTLSLGFGVGYLAFAWLLDRDGHAGAATPFVAVGLVALFTGVVAVSPDLEVAGTGVLLVVIGLTLAADGARAGRRATTWSGGGAVLLGLAVVILDITDADVTTFGVLALLCGLAVVALAQWVTAALDEPDELGEVDGSAVLAPAGDIDI